MSDRCVRKPKCQHLSQRRILIFQVIAPQFKHFQKLRDFVDMKLPPGFPVKVDIPVLPTVSARVTFQVRGVTWYQVGKVGDEAFSSMQDFCWKDDLDPSLFDIPPDYDEDPTRFPDL